MKTNKVIYYGTIAVTILVLSVLIFFAGMEKTHIDYFRYEEPSPPPPPTFTITFRDTPDHIIQIADYTYIWQVNTSDNSTFEGGMTVIISRPNGTNQEVDFGMLRYIGEYPEATTNEIWSKPDNWSGPEEKYNIFMTDIFNNNTWLLNWSSTHGGHGDSIHNLTIDISLSKRHFNNMDTGDSRNIGLDITFPKWYRYDRTQTLVIFIQKVS